MWAVLEAVQETKTELSSHYLLTQPSPQVAMAFTAGTPSQ